MELAYDSHASYLFTKDRALLKLAQKKPENRTIQYSDPVTMEYL